MKRASVILAASIIAAGFASARITKTRPSAAAGALAEAAPSMWAPFAPFVIGGGIEYQNQDDQTEFAFPFLVEYSATERLGFILEAEFADIHSRSSDVSSVGGFGDLETAVDYEFVTERRYRPALSLEAGVKWPTATDSELGEPGRDYSLGLIASKDLVLVELDLNLLYTFIGDREADDEIEASLACEWHFNPEFTLIAEVAAVTHTGSEPDSEIEATLGVGWNVNDHLKLEQGVVLKQDGEWEVIFAWEWSIGGD